MRDYFTYLSLCFVTNNISRENFLSLAQTVLILSSVFAKVESLFLRLMLSVARLLRAKPKIYYTFTDEAPALATYALLPVFTRFADACGVEFEKSDISVASRILAAFGLEKDNLAHLGSLAKSPEGLIIKLPNVSASIPQLNDAIAELQKQGYKIPNFPQEPKTEEEKAVKAKYAKVLGSAVNPVLREGNSDRRAAAPVKAYAQRNPHKLSPWPQDSKTHVAHMTKGDFFASEKSYVADSPTTVRIEHVDASGKVTVLKQETKVQAGEVLDAAFMSAKELRAFYEREFQDAKEKNVIVSLHLKATMMKVSDPIMFGHAVSVFYKSAFEKNAETLARIGANPNNGLASVLEKVSKLPEAERTKIEADFKAVYDERAGVAMVDSARGITNFHVPSDVIVDASMPPMIRDSGRMWNKKNELEDTKCLIPDRCYATQYQTIVEDVKANGQFNVKTMGHVSNVGLMAQAAEEYGSHDKTFEIPSAGTVRVVDAAGKTVFDFSVEKGDIWRMCQTKDAPIRDWVKLAYNRAVTSNTDAIFWLDPDRAHDRNMIAKVNEYSKQYAAEAAAKGVKVSIARPQDACKESLTRARAGKDTISVTGNVLRDYNTDMFPILELGTSAKMLSIVPMLSGGAMYETGAGGSAPKHVQQFVKEGHLRWDSLGEYLAVAACFEDLGKKLNNAKIANAGVTLNEAICNLLDFKRGPSVKVMEPDNRAASFWIANYWARAMAQKDSSFAQLSSKLQENEKTICEDLIKCQGSKVDIGGYYRPDVAKAEAAMRPSQLFNSILNS